MQITFKRVFFKIFNRSLLLCDAEYLNQNHHRWLLMNQNQRLTPWKLYFLAVICGSDIKFDSDIEAMMQVDQKEGYKGSKKTKVAYSRRTATLVVLVKFSLRMDEVLIRMNDTRLDHEVPILTQQIYSGQCPCSVVSLRMCSQIMLCVMWDLLAFMMGCFSLTAGCRVTEHFICFKSSSS